MATMMTHRLGTLNGDFIRYRESLGISQRELSRQTGLSQAAISYIEGQVKAPSLQTVMILARQFEMPLNEFLDRFINKG